MISSSTVTGGRMTSPNADHWLGHALGSASRRANPKACPNQWSAFGEVIRPLVTVDNDIIS